LKRSKMFHNYDLLLAYVNVVYINYFHVHKYKTDLIEKVNYF